MATWYVYSAAAGTASGADWTNAKTTLAAALTAGSAGDTYYIADDHAETQASAMSLAFKGTIGAFDKVYCARRSGGSVPPVAADLRTTATISTTGANSLTLTNSGSNAGHVDIYGVIFQAGSAANAASIIFTTANICFVFTNCGLTLNNTSASSNITLGNFSNVQVYLVNSTLTFGAVGQGINPSGAAPFLMRGGSLGGATMPTTLVKSSQGSAGNITLDGVDLSAMGSGKTVFASLNGNATGLYKAINCKLNASVTVAAAPSQMNSTVDIIGCDSGSTVARNERWLFQGTLTTETTIIRTGGASDGTTPYSWKLVGSGNNSKSERSFDSPWGAIWNAATGSAKTLTVHVVTDNVTLKDDEIWLEVEYLGASGNPQATLITDQVATLVTAANQATSTETWTTTGLTTPVKQKLDVTFTPQMAGPIRWRVRFGKTSTTVYVCPKAELS